MKKIYPWIKCLVIYPLLILISLIAVTAIITNLVTEASNDRDWSPDQAILPYADINGDFISIHNIRNFTYTSTTSYTKSYYNKTFNLNKIKGVSYIMEPFSGPGFAHTFLSFEFEGNQFVSISVEIRKEKGEAFSPIKGLFNQYELMYVVADEKDVIKLRTNYRKDLVYLYPVNTTKEKTRELFSSMIARVNELYKKPEFYNSITNTCTTNIVSHVNTITPNKVPLSYKVLFPGYSDELAYKLGLIGTSTVSFEDMRAAHLINEKAQKYADSPDFSLKIRQ